MLSNARPIASLLPDQLVKRANGFGCGGFNPEQPGAVVRSGGGFSATAHLDRG